MKLNKKNLNPKTSIVDIIETRKDFKDLGLKRVFKFETGFKIKNYKNKSLNETKRIIKGYASTTDKDRTDDIITIGALTKSKDDLLQEGSRTVFFNHDRSKPIGKVINTSLDNKGLIAEIFISKAKSAEDYWTQIKEGVLNSLSIGGRFKKVQVERDDEGKVVAFKILELELMEVSVVGIPANPKASIFSVVEKSFSGLFKENFSKKERHKMKKIVKKGSEEKMKKKVPSMTEDKVKALIEEAINPISTSMKKFSKTLKKSLSLINKPEEKTEKKEVEVKKVKKNSDKVPFWAKQLRTDMKIMRKRLSKKVSRKGSIEDTDEDEDEEVEEAEETPKKALKGYSDEASREYAKFVMDNPEVYEELKDAEKESVKKTYLCMMDRVTRKTK